MWGEASGSDQCLCADQINADIYSQMKWVRQADVEATKMMAKMVKEWFVLHLGLIPETVCRTGPLLDLLSDRKIELHIPIMDKSGRNEGM